MRTGLLKVGLPGAKEGLSEKDPTLADLLKPLGYVTGQFGKNHLGDSHSLPLVEADVTGICSLRKFGNTREG
jgi:arylsulfatase A-like enzyme